MVLLLVGSASCSVSDQIKILFHKQLPFYHHCLPSQKTCVFHVSKRRVVFFPGSVCSIVHLSVSRKAKGSPRSECGSALPDSDYRSREECVCCQTDFSGVGHGPAGAGGKGQWPLQQTQLAALVTCSGVLRVTAVSEAIGHF